MKTTGRAATSAASIAPSPDAINAATLAARLSARLDAPHPRGAALVIGRAARIISAPTSPDPGAVGVGQCAERAAIYEALLTLPPPRVTTNSPLRRRLDIRQVVLRGGSRGTEDAGPPCGACLQVLAEFAPDATVTWGTSRQPRGGETVADLLPGAFGPGHLEPYSLRPVRGASGGRASSLTQDRIRSPRQRAALCRRSV